MEGKWVSGCGLKRGFGDRLGAMQFYYRHKRNWNHRGKPGRIHAYKCDHCHMYHLGHTAQGSVGVSANG